MTTRRRMRPSPALVVAAVALFIALGGTSVAAVVALAPNSVATKHLKNGAVNSAKVKDHSLKAIDLASGVLAGGAQGEQGPAGPAGPAGPSDAYARFLLGPVVVPGAPTTITTLSIPAAGKYLLWAKATVNTAVVNANVSCRLLTEGADFDTSFVGAAAPWSATISNIVAHEFTAAGTASYQCQAAGAVTIGNLKMSAIRVGSLTNTG